jgi:hypothetical protein
MKSLIDIINEKLILSKTIYKHTEDKYFYHEALENGYKTTISNTINEIEYSVDNCKTWEILKPNEYTEEVKKSECIYFKGKNMDVLYDVGIGTFVSNKKFNCGGNIMSLIYGDDFIGNNKLLKNHQFSSLFYRNEYLISAKDLILPANKLTIYCYANMFNKCSSLVDSPKLPAKNISKWCYQYMFNGCNELVNGPEELPATTLAFSCYSQMFRECSSLKKGPILPAKTLVEKCYFDMFAWCTSLKEITMLSDDIEAHECLGDWVYNISGTGTFTKSKGVNIREGDSGIPKSWTIKEI